MTTRNEQIARLCAELDEVMSHVAFSDMEPCELTALLMVLRPVYDRVIATGQRPNARGPWDDEVDSG